MNTYIDHLELIAKQDVSHIKEADNSYGGSWKKRGGVGAYMMACRKFDRIETQVQKHGWDIFEAIRKDRRPEGIIDDIQDLRRYLMLIEAEINATTPVQTPE